MHTIQFRQIEFGAWRLKTMSPCPGASAIIRKETPPFASTEVVRNEEWIVARTYALKVAGALRIGGYQITGKPAAERP